MYTVEEIKEKVAKEHSYKNWRELAETEVDNELDVYILQVAQRFANQIKYEWIAINDHLPEDSLKSTVHDLLFTDGNKIYVGQLNFNRQWKDYKTDQFIIGVTHWMYIPALPVKQLGS